VEEEARYAFALEKKTCRKKEWKPAGLSAFFGAIIATLWVHEDFKNL